jgi:adenylate kinase family enzyme
MIGPKGCGKSTLAKELAFRTNMEVINFDNFLKSSGFSTVNYDDEEVTMTLIKKLINETAPRVLLEDFPRSEK